MIVEVKFENLAIDQNTNMPIMVLKEIKGMRTLPIWIGMPEAHAIALHKSPKKPARPLTHDLLKLIIEGLGAKLTKVVVNDMRNNTFYAKLHLQNNNNIVHLDSRPSDAIALALRCEVPIYVEEKVLEDKEEPLEKKETNIKADELRENLRNIDPSDFGKYSIG